MFRIERRIKHSSDAERVREFGMAVNYALKHGDALTNFTKAGHLEASNNYAERCTCPAAVGRKAFLFVGSERAGHAAAIYYSLVESCNANKVNPLTYLTYVLGNARNKSSARAFSTAGRSWFD